MDFYKWPSIEAFRSVAHNSAHRFVVPYRGKIKLHGTNAAIQFCDGEVAAQSRFRILSLTEDNLGFAKWLASISFPLSLEDYTLFGEWYGPGVQRGVGVSKIDRKVFAVFAVRLNGYYITEPTAIAHYVPDHPDIFVLPWYSKSIAINFSAVSEESLAIINAQVGEVEKCDSWVCETFGVSGTGEGLVYYPCTPEGTGLPLDIDDMSPEYLGRRVFKAKGEEHRVNGHKEAVSLKQAMIDGAPQFVGFAVTEARLRQALFEVCQDHPRMQLTGDFIKWVQFDIQKECSEELKAFENPGKVLGLCGARAVAWLKAQCSVAA